MKAIKNLIAAFLLITVAHTTFAQNTTTDNYLKFTDLKDIPIDLVWPATVTDGKYIYAINGQRSYNGTFSDGIFKYDPENESWALISKAAGAKLQSTAAYVPADGHAYLFGGINPENRVSPFVKSIDLKTGEVQMLDGINTSAAANSFSAEWNGKIYIWGGTEYGRPGGEGHAVASLYSFDPKSKTFSQLADMPQPGEISGTIVNGIIYTFGGYEAFLTTRYKNINTYNIATNTWSTATQLPASLSSNAVAAVGNLIFVVGDYNKGTFLGYYNTITNKFTQLKSNMKARRGAGAVVIGNKLYVLGGKSSYYRSVGGGTKSIQVADISAILNAANTSTASN
jgi:N-acetylneuraminic acid mutarotase